MQKTGLSRHFKVKHKDYMLWFDQSGLSKAMWIDPNYSPVCGIEDNKFLHLLLRDGDTVLDVGANIGTIALTASGIVGSAGKVYAIEPHPRTFVSLKSNIALNKRTNIHVINVALGAHSGTVLFSDSDDSQSAVIHHPSELQSQFLEVPVRRMDDLPLGKIPITLLKIDVEGYEKLVLEGGLETLGAHPIYTLKLMIGSSHGTGTRVFNCGSCSGSTDSRCTDSKAGGILPRFRSISSQVVVKTSSQLKTIKIFTYEQSVVYWIFLFKSLRDAAWIRYMGV